jgi:hypothetical protein
MEHQWCLWTGGLCPRGNEWHRKCLEKTCRHPTGPGARPRGHGPQSVEEYPIQGPCQQHICKFRYHTCYNRRHDDRHMLWVYSSSNGQSTITYLAVLLIGSFIDGYCSARHLANFASLLIFVSPTVYLTRGHQAPRRMPISPFM